MALKYEPHCQRQGCGTGLLLEVPWKHNYPSALLHAAMWERSLAAILQPGEKENRHMLKTQPQRETSLGPSPQFPSPVFTKAGKAERVDLTRYIYGAYLVHYVLLPYQSWGEWKTDVAFVDGETE